MLVLLVDIYVVVDYVFWLIQHKLRFVFRGFLGDRTLEPEMM